MTKEEFEGTLRSYGFEEDSEFKGVFRHPDSPLYTWYVDKTDYEEGEMAISYDLEYTHYREINGWRIIALYDLFKKT
jgi:hypothetical protein